MEKPTDMGNSSVSSSSIWDMSKENSTASPTSTDFLFLEDDLEFISTLYPPICPTIQTEGKLDEDVGLTLNKKYTEVQVERYRNILQEKVKDIKKFKNNGFGLVPIINSFTSKRRYSNSMSGKSIDMFLLGDEYASYSQGFHLNHNQGSYAGKRRKDYCSSFVVTEEMNTVLIEVEFPTTGRMALFQAVDYLIETTECLESVLGERAVMEMDGGTDLCVLRKYEYFPLITDIQEVPFMPVLRRAGQYDLSRFFGKSRLEFLLFDFCNNLLLYPVFSNYKMKVVDVELQMDGRKLIIFSEFVRKVKFNEYVKRVCDFCKQIIGTKHKTRVFIQNKFLKRN